MKGHGTDKKHLLGSLGVAGMGSTPGNAHDANASTLGLWGASATFSDQNY